MLASRCKKKCKNKSVYIIKTWNELPSNGRIRTRATAKAKRIEAFCILS